MPIERVDRPGKSQEATGGKKNITVRVSSVSDKSDDSVEIQRLSTIGNSTVTWHQDRCWQRSLL